MCPHVPGLGWSPGASGIGVFLRGPPGIEYILETGAEDQPDIGGQVLFDSASEPLSRLGGKWLGAAVKASLERWVTCGLKEAAA